MFSTLAFLLSGACVLAFAWLVVRASDLVHAVLWLGATLTATAVLYAVLGASFLAGVQVLVYVGGVTTLLIFGLMITRRHEGIVVRAESSNRARGALLAGGLFAVLSLAIRGTDGLASATVLAAPATPADLARELLGERALAFDLVSLLLLVAMIGALVLARRNDPARRSAGAPTPRPATEASR